MDAPKLLALHRDFWTLLQGRASDISPRTSSSVSSRFRAARCNGRLVEACFLDIRLDSFFERKTCKLDAQAAIRPRSTELSLGRSNPVIYTSVFGLERKVVVNTASLFPSELTVFLYIPRPLILT